MFIFQSKSNIFNVLIANSLEGFILRYWQTHSSQKKKTQAQTSKKDPIKLIQANKIELKSASYSIVIVYKQ